MINFTCIRTTRQNLYTFLLSSNTHVDNSCFRVNFSKMICITIFSYTYMNELTIDVSGFKKKLVR